MQKLLAGIRDFHHRVRPTVREQFARLALGQAPDCLFIACSDSRVVVNLFASTDPGDLFVVRNVGNMVPPCDHGHDADQAPVIAHGEDSVGAAIEFATLALDVKDVVVCGHSSCGAMHAMLTGQQPDSAPDLASWLEHARPSLARLDATADLSPTRPPIDRLSQAHVLQQLDHLRSYPSIAERIDRGSLRLHGWWFDLAAAEVLGFDDKSGQFIPIVDLHPAPAPG